jgi:hypothetical protein
MRRKPLRKLLLVVVALVAALGAFYWQHERTALRLIAEEGFSGEQANAFKHAYAAAQTYRVAQALLPKPQAASLTFWLGYVSEYAEQTLRTRFLDTPHELMKDFTNNQIGVAAEHWRRQQMDAPSRYDTVLFLARTHTLVTGHEGIVVAPELAALQSYTAIDALYEASHAQRSSVVMKTEAALQAMR